jgi:catechol-2,3-dioxygenase
VGVRRLNHAVLWVRDATRSAEFYTENLGFTVKVSAMDGRAVFLRAAGSTNDHDLGLFSKGPGAPAPAEASTGLYHLAWQVDTIEELARLRTVLARVGALVGESDHGVSKSLYAKDPDGIEFEIMWAVPAEAWPTDGGGIEPLRLDSELARWAGVVTT